MSSPQPMDDCLVLLERTPTALAALLGGLPDAWTRRDEGAGTWSAYDVIGHLRYCEREDWIPRVRRILAEGEAVALTPLDRWAQARENATETLAARLDGFARMRTGNLQALRSLNLHADDMARRGQHPSLGVVTLGQLLATWAAHDLTHLHQIARVLAHQQRSAVGPWRRYLGVLRCDGHSEQS